MTEQNKSYLGYAPKHNNVTKLAQYLRNKQPLVSALSADKNAVNNRFTSLSQNKILSNKRF